jgi:hypothetical protein
MNCIECARPTDARVCAHCGAAQWSGRFQHAAVIGRGAGGRVYRASDKAGQAVAVKELSFLEVPSAGDLDAFEREAQTLAQLDHPRVPRYLESYREGEGVQLRLYLAQELIDGASLLERASAGPLPESEVLKIAERLLQTLSDLHGRPQPLVHRDIKPANLVQRRDGELVLVDFGSARALARGKTHNATLVGTVGYMPFEQLGGTVTPASDLHAVGATLLHLATGKPPTEFLQPEGGLHFDAKLIQSPALSELIRELLAPLKRRPQTAAQALALLGRQLPTSGTVLPNDRANLTFALGCALLLLLQLLPAAQALPWLHRFVADGVATGLLAALAMGLLRRSEDRGEDEGFPLSSLALPAVAKGLHFYVHAEWSEVLGPIATAAGFALPNLIGALEGLWPLKRMRRSRGALSPATRAHVLASSDDRAKAVLAVGAIVQLIGLTIAARPQAGAPYSWAVIGGSFAVYLAVAASALLTRPPPAPEGSNLSEVIAFSTAAFGASVLALKIGGAMGFFCLAFGPLTAALLAAPGAVRLLERRLSRPAS